MLEVKVDIIDWRRCNSWVRVLTKNMLCAGLERGGRDSCQVGAQPSPIFSASLAHSLREAGFAPQTRRAKIGAGKVQRVSVGWEYLKEGGMERKEGPEGLVWGGN